MHLTNLARVFSLTDPFVNCREQILNTWELTEDDFVDEHLANDGSDEDGDQPHDDLEERPGVLWVLGDDEGEGVADDGDEALGLAVRYRVLGVDEEVAEGDEVGDGEAQVRVLEVVAEVLLHEERVHARLVQVVDARLRHRLLSA